MIAGRALPPTTFVGAIALRSLQAMTAGRFFPAAPPVPTPTGEITHV